MNSRGRCTVALLLAAAALPGCMAGPDPTLVTAARQYQEAVATEYLRYVDADPTLDAMAKARRHATVARFEEAIATREARQVQR